MTNKNYIAEFMKDNDLEVGEEFEVELKGDVMHFTKDYTLFSKNGKSRAYELGFLLTGNAQVKKLPKQEYIEVTNDVPRFTEIEVRDRDGDKWIVANFICELDESYLVTVGKNLTYVIYNHARMLKPTEPEFKEGELIEVSRDEEDWYTRKFTTKYNDLYCCEFSEGKVLYGWKYARLIK